MKKYVIGVAIAAALALAGCSQTLQILAGGTANPITPTRALQVHTAFVAGVEVPSGDYARLPRCGKGDNPCSDQKVVNQLRLYVNAADKDLSQLDDWAQGNPTLDGGALYSAALITVKAAQDFATQNGIKITTVQSQVK